MFAQGQMITAHFDFNGVAQGRKPDQLNRSANQQSHLHETYTVLGGDLNFCDGRFAANRKGGQALNGGDHGSRHERFRGLRLNRLNPDFLGQFRADAQTDIANLANNSRVLTEQLDSLLLTETEFS